MAKAPKSAFVCQSCGAHSSKWAGRCNECGEWNTMAEELIERRQTGMALSLEGSAVPIALDEVETHEEFRLETGMPELDRVLGGGIVPGSLVLIGGPPGIGKSTLLLQICRQLASLERPILYVSGEESARQIRLRSDRLAVTSSNKSENQSKSGILLLAETRLEAIENHIQQVQPGLVIIDSIQTLFKSDLSPAPGSVTQVRECAASLMRLAKTSGIPTVLVGHVTKDGQLAGPRVLEHLVDTVLSFEGEGQHNVRTLRSVKNRFGAAQEVGLFEMAANGLVPIPDASKFFLSQRARGTSGSVVFPSMEGTRPVLVELQALVSDSMAAEKGAPPARRAVGLDINRMGLLLAVISRRVPGMALGLADVYANVAGGLKLNEPALDLPLALAIASARRDVAIDGNLAACGEVGLGGEIRAVHPLEPRLKELSKMGFQKALVPKVSLADLKESFPGLQLIPCDSLQEAFRLVGIPLSVKKQPKRDEVEDF
jgi:DNA repair protein RadA/Sms